MSRKLRVISQSGIYHIILRGNNRMEIFRDHEDFEKLLSVLKRYKEKSNYEIYAYCLMNNHFHILLKIDTEPLSQVMRRICVSYVYWYNQKYSRVGNLFQDRFRSESVENDEYFLTVLRYILRNPVKAGIIKDIENYKWSSYNEYNSSGKLTDIDFGLSLFSEDKNIAIKLFKDFINETNNDKCLEFEN